MKYKEITPCPALQPYIHSYWELRGENTDDQRERIFPDGCAGVVINLGDTCVTDNGLAKMDFGKTYAVGAITSFKDSFINENTHLFGVCLKPGVFPNFYNYAPQNEIINQTIQLENAQSLRIDKFMDNGAHYLNEFFTNRLNTTNRPVQSVIESIHQSQGQAAVNKIANEHFTTVRQLERKFKAQLGMSPKAYARIVRFQNALSKINDPKQEKNLFDIAFECGYYDHSHLANDIKRNTGMVPSQL